MSDLRIINSGTVPYGVKVRSEGQLETFSISVDEFENVSARSRLSFAWSLVPKNSDNGDTVMLVRNDSSDLVLHISHIITQSDLNTMVQIHTTDGAAFTPTGLAVVGVCLNRTGPRDADATAIGDETQNAQGNIIWQHEIIADIPTFIDLHGAVLLGKNQSIAIDYTTGSTALCTATVYGFYAIPDEQRS